MAKSTKAKLAYMARYRREHPEIQEAYEARAYAQPGSRYRGYGRRDNLLKKYGLTSAAYESMLASQKGVCAICEQPPKKYRLAVDHCHVTGQVRKLLCIGCNVKIGHLEDSEFQRKAAAYLALFKS